MERKEECYQGDIGDEKLDDSFVGEPSSIEILEHKQKEHNKGHVQTLLVYDLLIHSYLPEGNCKFEQTYPNPEKTGNRLHEATLFQDEPTEKSRDSLSTL